MITKTYKITFTSRLYAGLALWEIHAWGIPESHYNLDTSKNIIYFASAQVVDVITESVPARYFSVEVEQKLASPQN